MLVVWGWRTVGGLPVTVLVCHFLGLMKPSPTSQVSDPRPPHLRSLLPPAPAELSPLPPLSPGNSVHWPLSSLPSLYSEPHQGKPWDFSNLYPTGPAACWRIVGIDQIWSEQKMEVVSHLIRERKGFNYENITHPRSDGARQVHVMPTQGCCTEDCHAQ